VLIVALFFKAPNQFLQKKKRRRSKSISSKKKQQQISEHMIFLFFLQA